MKVISGKRMCRLLEQRGWTCATLAWQTTTFDSVVLIVSTDVAAAFETLGGELVTATRAEASGSA